MKASSLLRLAIATSLSFSINAQADQFYGPVKENDTLSKIFKNHYTGSNRRITRLMTRIAENNPSAFAEGNIDFLLKGSVLRLPGDDWNLSGGVVISEGVFPGPLGEEQQAEEQLRPVQQRPAGLVQTSPTTFTTASGVTIVVPENQAMTDVPVFNAADEAVNAENRYPDEALVANRNLRSKVAVLETERLALQEEVSKLEAETRRLAEKIQALSQMNRRSDEQLRILDTEIIRLTKSLIEQSYIPNVDEASAEVGALQQKLKLAEAENYQLTRELSLAKSELSHAQVLKEKAEQRIAEVATQNKSLQAELGDSQPGANFYAEQNESRTLSLAGGLLRLPLWIAILGGALLSLILISLFATRRRRYEPEELESTVAQTKPVNRDNVFSLNSLLESESEAKTDKKAAEAAIVEEEGNVFQMFDGGSLTMDLKLDMARAYIDVDDSANARVLLDEVMGSGSEIQRRKASRLLAEAA